MLGLAVAIVSASLAPVALRAEFGIFHSDYLIVAKCFPVSTHRVAHFLTFGIFAVLVRLAATRSYQQALGLPGVIFLGISIEYVQHLFPHHVFETWDVRDDTAAAAIGYGLATLYAIWSKPRTQSVLT